MTQRTSQQKVGNMPDRLDIGTIEIDVKPKHTRLAKLRTYIGAQIIKLGAFVINGRD